MVEQRFPGKQRVKAIWLSDIHLGTRDCKAEYLLDFLDTLECEYLFLVGDIVDLWAMKRRIFWPESHNRVVRKILKLSKKADTRVIYIPGNHDYPARELAGEMFGAIEVHRNFIYQTKDGKRLLVQHGDEFDAAIRISRVMHIVGGVAYVLLLIVNRFINRFRKYFGYSYYSLAGYIKTRVGKAALAIRLFEEAALEEVCHRNLDGIVCGHIHHPNMYERDGKSYFNDGDWVENCTALVEHRNGRFEMLRWRDNNCLPATVTHVDSLEQLFPPTGLQQKTLIEESFVQKEAG